MYIIWRALLNEPFVGPFSTREEAIAWQRRDNKQNGDPGDWSVWKLSPGGYRVTEDSLRAGGA